jgi:uncharacterized membrane protein
MKEIIPMLLIVLTVSFSLLYTERLPEKVAIHFDLKGNPDRWATRKVAVWLIPVLALVAYGILTVLDVHFPKLLFYHWKLLLLFSLLNAHIGVLFFAMGAVRSIHYILAPMYIINCLYPLYIVFVLRKQ